VAATFGGASHSAFEIRDGGRHLGVARVRDAPAVDLDRAHGVEARREQRIALRGHLFEDHVRKGQSNSEGLQPGPRLRIHVRFLKYSGIALWPNR
jgi:hypothetical protein